MSESRVLIYDGDCQFCQLSLDFGIRHLKVFPQYVAYQRIDPSVFGLTASQVRSQVWMASELPSSNNPAGGHAAAAEILRMQPGIFARTLGVIMVIVPFSMIAKAFYAFIAKNRHRMPGASKACKLEDTYPTQN